MTGILKKFMPLAYSSLHSTYNENDGDFNFSSFSKAPATAKLLEVIFYI
jgi:hypothetical protein